MNDVYLAHDEDRTYALRAWRGGWRGDPQEKAAAVLAFLDEAAV